MLKYFEQHTHVHILLNDDFLFFNHNQSNQELWGALGTTLVRAYIHDMPMYTIYYSKLWRPLFSGGPGASYNPLSTVSYSAKRIVWYRRPGALPTSSVSLRRHWLCLPAHLLQSGPIKSCGALYSWYAYVYHLLFWTVGSLGLQHL